MFEGWGAAIAAGTAAGAIGGAVISSSGAKSAASDSANAAEAGTNAQLSMFNTTQQDYAPQIKLGQGAANLLSGIYGLGGTPGGDYDHFFQTPGYQFTLGQGENAIQRGAAANGSLYSTSTLGALNNYAQGQASTQYNSYVNQLLTMAGLGNAASSGVGTAATATGQGVSNSLLNTGNANASGVLGSSNAYTNALGSLTNGNSGLSNLLQSYADQSTATSMLPGTNALIANDPDMLALQNYGN